uniref:transposase n=1 Tax=Paenibacillus silvae TaxID=1325358 RepID=UPI003570A367
MNLKEKSFGKRKGKTGITKCGRSRLRTLLFRCIMPMVAKNEKVNAFLKTVAYRALWKTNTRHTLGTK